ncbi:MAG: hypothetical protein OEM67_05350 [Thermoleophilia bacterium]|nr:hypothetical protein [Thermoleophilia bacterium]
MPMQRPLTWGRPLIEIDDPLEAARHLAYAAYLIGLEADATPGADSDSHHPEEEWPLSVRAAFDRIGELLPE